MGMELEERERFKYTVHVGIISEEVILRLWKGIRFLKDK